MRKWRLVAYLFLSSLCVATPAYADIGAPMIFITLPMLIIGLVPIIILETFVLMKLLRIAFKDGIKTAALMNVISTLVGIPVTWGALVFIQIFTGGGAAYGLQSPLQKFLAVTWQAPWLIPYESDLYWMVPSASLVLLIPFFFASYLIEALIARKILKGFDKAVLHRSVFLANISSYAVLFVLALGWLLFSLMRGK